VKLKVTKGATVQVIAGSDKGKRGTVLDLKKETMMVRVQGVRMTTKHSKKDGVVKSEGYIHYSNVKLVDAAKKETKKTSKKAAKSKTA